MDPSLERLEAQPYAAVRTTVRMDELASILGELWPEVMAWLTAANIPPAGAPLIRYLNINMPDAMTIDVGIPITELTDSDERIIVSTLPAGQWAVGTFTGPYEELDSANATLQAWAAENKVSFRVAREEHTETWDGRVESYLTDPVTEPDPSKWRTAIAYLTVD